MDEMNWTLPPDLEIALKKYYGLPGPSDEFASRLGHELRRRHSNISDTSMKTKRSFMKSLRTRPALAILVAILALLLLSSVAYAIGKLSGHIPGFGFTSGDPYVLNIPIEVTQEGIVLNIEQAVHDETGLWIELNVYGLPDGDDYAPAYILSQSGEKIQSQSGGGISREAGLWQLTYVFPVLDHPDQPVTLVLENLGGQTIQTTFSLRPANTDEVLPAFSADTLPAQGEIRDHMALVLDYVAMSTDRTVLQVSLHFDQPGITLSAPWNVTMTDDQGYVYPLMDISPLTMEIGQTRLYQTVPLQGNEQLTLKLVSFPSESELPMLRDFSTDPASFTFDPGPNLQVGQTWTLDETLHLDQFTLHIVAARMTSPTELLFELEPIQNVTGAMFYSTLARGASGGVPVQNSNFTTAINFAEVPKLPFEIQVRGVYYTAHGPWQVEWQAPAATVLNFPTMTPEPSPAPLVTATLTSRDPLLLEIQALAQKFDQSIVQGPAWIHIVYETTTENRTPGQTYPPPYYQDEQWYEIDATGSVTRNLTTHRDAEGNILQQSAFIGTKGINFTVGDVFEIPPYHLSFDFLTRDLDSALQRNQPVLREEASCDDGSNCLLITVMDQYAQPIQNPDQPNAFHGHGLRVWIKAETGQQAKLQSFWVLLDGSEQITYTQRTLSMERVTTPPPDVLDLMDKVVFPP
jgi:hypothetical protein